MDTQFLNNETDKLTYQLNYDLYKTTSDLIPLEGFNISVHVSDFKLKGKALFENVEKFKSLINKTFTVKHKKYNTFTCFSKDKTENIHVNEDLFNLIFSTPNCPNLDIDKFIQAVKTADISTEFYQIARSLIHGYPEYQINDDTMIYKGLRAFLKEEPYSFLYLDDFVKGSKALYFPSCQQNDGISDKFSQIMAKEFNQSPPLLRVLNDYLADWETALKKKSGLRHKIG